MLAMVQAEAQADPQTQGSLAEDQHVGAGHVRGRQDSAWSWGLGKAVPLSCMLVKINIRCIRVLRSL